MTKVLCGGKFNIIHPGHIFFLEEAKKLGDKLVVVLANDENNKSKFAKPAKWRQSMLRSTALPDKIIIGDKKDMFKIVKKEKPNIIVLGYDQKFPKLKASIKKAKLDIEIVRIKKFGRYNTTKILEKTEKQLKEYGILPGV